LQAREAAAELAAEQTDQPPKRAYARTIRQLSWLFHRGIISEA